MITKLSHTAVQFIGHIRQIDPNLYNCLVALVEDVGNNDNTIEKIQTIIDNAGLSGGAQLSFGDVMKRISMRA